MQTNNYSINKSYLHQSNDTSMQGKPVEFSYSFPDYTFMDTNPERHSRLSGFKDEQIDQTKLAMQSWEDVANIIFTQSEDNLQGKIIFGNYYNHSKMSKRSIEDDTVGYHTVHSESPDINNIWINSSYLKNQTPDHINGGRQILAHEIGHALGIRMHAYNYAETNYHTSLMTPSTQYIVSEDFKPYYASAPLLDDIIALQKLYGANLNTRKDNTIYGFNSNTDRDFFTTSSSEEKLIFAIWDAGGNDTLDFSGYYQDQYIDLNPMQFSDVGGLKGNVSIASGVIIENAIAGYGDDIIIGNDANNTLGGGAGRDVIYGRGGDDDIFGDAGIDMIYGDAGHDYIYGGTGDDYIYGGSGNDNMEGGIGADDLYGGTGNDRMWGNEGSDRMLGNAGDDWIDGGAGDDWLVGGSGADVFIGGEGHDIFRFEEIGDSSPNAPDMILDFECGIDKIDLSKLNPEGRGITFVDRVDNTSEQIAITYRYEEAREITSMSVYFGEGSEFKLEFVGQQPLQETDFIF